VPVLSTRAEFIVGSSDKSFWRFNQQLEKLVRRKRRSARNFVKMQQKQNVILRLKSSTTI